jgi:hypothetical protein
MKNETVLLLETLVAVLYVVTVLGSSFYLMDSLMSSYQQMALTELELLLAL